MADLVEVIQADRDAAANWYYRDENWPEAYAKAVHLGTEDGDPLVQAFAAHRLATRPPASGVAEENERLRARVRELECELGINPERNAEIAAIAGRPMSALEAVATTAKRRFQP